MDAKMTSALAPALSMNLVAVPQSGISPLHLIRSDIRADSRRLLRSKGSKREFVRENLAPFGLGEGVRLNDSAETALDAWRKAKSNLLEVVSEAENARRLLAVPELRDDVAFCLRRDVFNLAAALGRDGAIRISI
jgi:hypothetical protein